ncbi:MAG: hypothetical protein Q4G59_06325 [Planctomycetia bacterium]|nr:hypothetical protein [Planctomycetia bacterium]
MFQDIKPKLQPLTVSNRATAGQRLQVYQSTLIALVFLLFSSWANVVFEHCVVASDNIPQSQNAQPQSDFELIGVVQGIDLNTIPCPGGSILVPLRLPEQESSDEQTANNNNDKLPRDQYIVFRLNNLSPQEELLLQDAANGIWDNLSPIEATLVAEAGMTLDSLKRYREKIAAYEQQLAARTRGITDPEKLTRIVFEFLHDTVLTGGYNLNRSNLSVVLDTGVFNCVSATILFNYFASRQGLAVTGLETTGHAKSRVIYQNEYLDIETTCTNWNLLPDRRYPLSKQHVVARPVHETANEATGSNKAHTQELYSTEGLESESLVPVSIDGTAAADESGQKESPSTALTLRRKRMRQINFVQLTATVYYNQGVDRSQDGDLGGALVAYIKAIHLDPSNRTVMGNLKATLNNWTIELATTQKNFPESIRIADCGLLLDPAFDQFRMNLPIFYQHWILELRKESRDTEADYLTKEFRKRFP